MAASPSDLTLDCNPTKPTMNQDQKPLEEEKLQDFLTRLEDERLKIDAFKRELPLCMQLLNNAMETYKRQLEAYQPSNEAPRPVLEEFIPLKNMSFEESEKPSSSDKASWMVSAQLWSRDDGREPGLKLEAKTRCGGAFHPFSKEKSTELALVSGEKEVEVRRLEKENGEKGGRREGGSKSGGGDQLQQSKGGGGSNVSCDGLSGSQRKARRCWSPDLHRRFVNALQILGGSQATISNFPIAIFSFEILIILKKFAKLYGKNKYRLHTRRPIPGPPAVAPATPQLLVLGGIWVPPDYATSATAAAAPALYGAHPLPAHYCHSPHAPHDYYQSPPPPALVAAAAAQFHGQLPPPGRNGCAESDQRKSGRERSESIEDGEREEEEEEEGEEEGKLEVLGGSEVVRELI
ncbi:myb family transcription factor EFM-like [Phalaenopsis equestris]|uniref:myb family transcription factor EFM-like n=1 Tax=Phalaenopsis equestris TaxID=78828 RepID=UPI0009E6490A|nr:myb family transcription factor EFM-like [Phalaenopsis equestris]